MDWMEQEQERGITIKFSAATTCFERPPWIVIIDTPLDSAHRSQALPCLAARFP